MIQNKKIIASILFVLISVVCPAQVVTPPPPTPPPPPGLPVDGAIVALLLAGIVYGIYKVWKSNKALSN